jgi:hypothetical protein
MGATTDFFMPMVDMSFSFHLENLGGQHLGSLWVGPGSTDHETFSDDE